MALGSAGHLDFVSRKDAVARMLNTTGSSQPMARIVGSPVTVDAELEHLAHKGTDPIGEHGGAGICDAFDHCSHVCSGDVLRLTCRHLGNK